MFKGLYLLTLCVAIISTTAAAGGERQATENLENDELFQEQSTSTATAIITSTSSSSSSHSDDINTPSPVVETLFPEIEINNATTIEPNDKEEEFQNATTTLIKEETTLSPINNEDFPYGEDSTSSINAEDTDYESVTDADWTTHAPQENAINVKDIFDTTFSSKNLNGQDYTRGISVLQDWLKETKSDKSVEDTTGTILAEIATETADKNWIEGNSGTEENSRTEENSGTEENSRTEENSGTEKNDIGTDNEKVTKLMNKVKDELVLLEVLREDQVKEQEEIEKTVDKLWTDLETISEDKMKDQKTKVLDTVIEPQTTEETIIEKSTPAEDATSNIELLSTEKPENAETETSTEEILLSKTESFETASTTLKTIEIEEVTEIVLPTTTMSSSLSDNSEYVENRKNSTEILKSEKENEQKDDSKKSTENISAGLKSIDDQIQDSKKNEEQFENSENEANTEELNITEEASEDPSKIHTIFTERAEVNITKEENDPRTEKMNTEEPTTSSPSIGESKADKITEEIILLPKIIKETVESLENDTEFLLSLTPVEKVNNEEDTDFSEKTTEFNEEGVITRTTTDALILDSTKSQLENVDKFAKVVKKIVKDVVDDIEEAVNEKESVTEQLESVTPSMTEANTSENSLQNNSSNTHSNISSEATAVIEDGSLEKLIDETGKLKTIVEEIMNKEEKDFQLKIDPFSSKIPNSDGNNRDEERINTINVITEEDEDSDDVEKQEDFVKYEDVLRNSKSSKTNWFADEEKQDSNEGKQFQELEEPQEDNIDVASLSAIVYYDGSKMCINASKLAIKITTNDSTEFWVPTTALVGGNCDKSGSYLKFTWTTTNNNHHETTENLTFTLDNDLAGSTLITHVSMELQKDHVNSTQLRVKLSEDPVTIELPHNGMLQIVNPAIKLYRNNEENVTTAGSVLTANNALALQIASGTLCILCIVISLAVFTYRKIRNKTRIFKVSSLEK